MRYTLFLSIVCFIGCTSTTTSDNLSFGDLEFVSTYTNPAYGEIKGNDARLIADREECQKNVYSEGVMVNGQLLKDPSVLNKIESDYRFSFSKEYLRNNTKIVSDEKILKDAIEHIDAAPAHISEIKEKQKLAHECLRINKQYKLVKTESYDKKTGKLVSTTKH